MLALCTVLLMLVAWCFAHLAARHPGAGSTYTYVGVTLGQRAGLVAGWITLGAYLSFAMVAVAGFGLFGSNILARFPTGPQLSPDALALIGAAIIGALLLLVSNRAFRDEPARGGQFIEAMEHRNTHFSHIICMISGELVRSNPPLARCGCNASQNAAWPGRRAP